MRRRIFLLLLVVTLIAAFALPFYGANSNRTSDAAKNAPASTTQVASTKTAQVSAGHVLGHDGAPLAVPALFPHPAVKAKAVPTPVSSNGTSNSTTVTFTETGLPAGTQWGVSFGPYLQYSSVSTIIFSAPNGTYGFSVTYVAGYAPNPNNGTISVIGSAVTQAITFTRAPLYAVSFVESGLAPGTQWTVSMFNSSGQFSIYNSSSTNTINFAVINGSYTFGVYPASGYVTSPPFGYVFVTAANVTQQIECYPTSATVYNVFIQETGFPGSIWNVSLNGVNQSTPGQYGFASYLVPNGTYHFSVSRFSGYTAYPPSGTIRVSGVNTSQSIYYYANSVQVSNVTFTGSNLHSSFGLIVEVINSTNSSTINATYLYTNFTASNSVTAYIPVGNYLSVVGEDNSPSFVYNPSAYNISEIVFISYLNITSSAPVTVNTLFPTLWKVTLQEVNLRDVSLWGIFAGSSNLESLLGNVTITPSTSYYSIFQGYANLSKSQTNLTAYLPDDIYGYTASVSAYNQTGNFTVSGANIIVNINFPKAFYTVTFSETGLPLGYYWSVTINGTNIYNFGNSINFTLPNGTYSFTVQPVFGYLISPAAGVVTVAGANVSQTIVFTHESTYDVTFFESGLPVGTQWSVTLNSTSMTSTDYSTGSSIVFYMPTGNYTYTVSASSGYILSPSHGTVIVLNAPAYVHVISLGYGYSVKFTETGLPSGTTWYVNLSNGKSLSSSSSSIALELVNGSYNYTVGTVNSKYSANSGSFTVSGSSRSVAVAFTTSVPVEYTVTFSESGLPAGTSWSVTLNGTAHSSTSANISFSRLNGTYAFTVGNVTGYSSSPGSGNLTVSGSNLTKTITFSKQSSTITKSSTGLSKTDYEIIGGVVVVAVIAGVAGLMAARRRRL